jgi:adenylosuccinate lyase
MAMNNAALTAHQLRDSSAFVNYGAAEVQHAQHEQLATLRLQTYESRALAKQFEHGINQHLPDGVAHQIDTSRYVTDEVSGLVIDRPPRITSTQHKAFVDMLRERAPTSVAYSLDDLSGYTGIEPPLRIVLGHDGADSNPYPSELVKGRVRHHR